MDCDTVQRILRRYGMSEEQINVLLVLHPLHNRRRVAM